MTPKVYNFNPRNRGDTFHAFLIRPLADGSPMNITAARLHVRTTEGILVLAYETGDGTAVVQGDDVIFKRREAAETKDFEVGKHVYDIELTQNDGTVETYVTGKFEITADISRDE